MLFNGFWWLFSSDIFLETIFLLVLVNFPTGICNGNTKFTFAYASRGMINLSIVVIFDSLGVCHFTS